jgi:hypothetical protein
MKTLILILLAVGLQAQAADLKKLSLLYIADGDAARTAAFKKLFETHVGKHEITKRQGFNPAKAQPFDVVVLDWHQDGNTQEEWKRPCPLGDRAAWNKPTVLLGSAGLNVAVVWQVRGGGG